MPTSQEISDKVKKTLAEKASIDVTDIIETGELTKHPLYLDDTALGFIAIKLNTYVVTNSTDESVSASEVRKSGLTVTGLIKLITTKIKGV